LLRQDNADLRLTEKSYRIGLAGQERMEKVLHKFTSVKQIKSLLQKISLEPDQINHYLQKINSSLIDEKQKVFKLLLRPDVNLYDMMSEVPELKLQLKSYSKETLEQAEIQVKYERYIEKEQQLAQRMSALENTLIPETFNYDSITALSAEALQKFKKIKPRTIGQAGRISGVNPSDVQILMVYMGR
jgi:tRNA uridine 5-carboxymethylaminomethyl modification enzyme